MWRNRGSSAKSGLLAAALLSFVALPAAAQSPLCADLQAQYLAAVGSLTGRTVGTGQRMLDMDRLSRELGNAQMAARQGNCNRFLFFGPRPSPQCPAILSTVSRLQQQLARMRSGQRSLFVFSPEEDRDRLRDWLLQNGCNIPQPGGQRTICVRTCDGYFFPISSSASRQNLTRDDAVCQSMYAGVGQAELFGHSSSRDLADAVTGSGKRYGDQPYAFLFRQAFFPSCQRQLKNGIAALGERYFTARAERTGSRVAVAASAFRYPMPRLRPVDRQQDPETVANRAGELAVAPYVREEERATTVVATRRIRQVGEAWYAQLFDPAKPYVEPTAHRPPLGFDLIGSAKAAMALGAEATTGELAPQLR